MAYLVGLAVVGGLMLLLWPVSLVRRDASIVDAFWGPGFAVAAWVYFALSDPRTQRGLLVAILVTLWGLRLGVFILWRNHGQGEDYRYREMRERHGERFARVSLFSVFLLQALILWVVSAPLWAAQWSGSAPVPTWIDVVGALLFAAGLLFESVGDRQLASFKSDPANRGRVLDRGLWRYTRHPNYFGDAMVWWGLGTIALQIPGAWWTVAGPALMTFLLMRVSGVTLLERKLERTKPAYRDYVKRTSAFFPRPPRVS